MTDKKVKNADVFGDTKDQKEAKAILELGDAALVPKAKKKEVKPSSPAATESPDIVAERGSSLTEDDFGYGLFSPMTTQDVDKVFDELTPARVPHALTGNVTSLPKLVIGGKEIELTKHEGNIGNWETKDHSHRVYESDPNTGNNAYGRYNEYIQASKVNKNWYIAIVGGVRILMTPGSQLTANRLESTCDYFYFEGDEPKITLVVRYSSIKAEVVSVRKTVKITNSHLDVDNLFLIGGSVKDSRITATETVTLNNTRLIGAQINVRSFQALPKSRISKSRFEQLSSVKIAEGVDIDDINLHNWKEPYTVDFVADYKVKGLDMSGIPGGTAIHIGHRADYGVIQGLDPVHFAKAVSNVYSVLPIGMVISKQLIKFEDISEAPFTPAPFQFGRPWDPPVPQTEEIGVLEKIVREIYNPSIFNPDIGGRYNNFGRDKVNPQIQPALREQLEGIKTQITSRMRLWELAHTLLGGQ